MLFNKLFCYRLLFNKLFYYHLLFNKLFYYHLLYNNFFYYRLLFNKLFYYCLLYNNFFYYHLLYNNFFYYRLLFLIMSYLLCPKSQHRMPNRSTFTHFKQAIFYSLLSKSGGKWSGSNRCSLLYFDSTVTIAHLVLISLLGSVYYS